MSSTDTALNATTCTGIANLDTIPAILGTDLAYGATIHTVPDLAYCTPMRQGIHYLHRYHLPQGALPLIFHGEIKSKQPHSWYKLYGQGFFLSLISHRTAASSALSGADVRLASLIPSYTCGSVPKRLAAFSLGADADQTCTDAGRVSTKVGRRVLTPAASVPKWVEAFSLGIAFVRAGTPPAMMVKVSSYAPTALYLLLYLPMLYPLLHRPMTPLRYVRYCIVLCQSYIRCRIVLCPSLLARPQLGDVPPDIGQHVQY
eukprot:449348-Rhodomonas_salina.2